jgi:hypothetical protein
VLGRGKRGGPAAFRQSPGGGEPRRGTTGRFPSRPVSPEPPPAAPQRTAANVAERTLLRALLSDEWTQAVRGRVTPEDFPDAETVRLVDALLPLIEGGIAPRRRSANSATPSWPITPTPCCWRPTTTRRFPKPLITDCLYALEMRRRRGEIGEIRAQAAPDPEGKRDGDDELLRRWEQKARAMKAPDRPIMAADTLLPLPPRRRWRNVPSGLPMPYLV